LTAAVLGLLALALGIAVGKLLTVLWG